MRLPVKLILGSKMKKILIAVCASASFVSLSATAQSAFEGAYGQIGVGYQTVSPSVSDVRISGAAGGITLNNFPLSSSTGTTGDFGGTATLGYNFKINDQFLLGIGAEFSPFASSNSNINANYGPDSDGSFYRANTTFKLENSYNIFLSPGLVVDKDKLLYAKVGFTGANAKGANQNINLTGYSLGLGYKQVISGGWYGFGELNYASYGKENIKTNYNSLVNVGGTLYNAPTTATAKVGANTFNVLVGVGYRF
jgi:outer membrane immunogenic protein